jgi:hypothetical protein
VFAAGFILAAAQGFAQQPWVQTLGPAGVSPTGSYAISNLETIDNVYGGVSYNIPLASLPPGRAGFSMGLPLVYNSNIWNVVQVGLPGGTCAIPSETGGGIYCNYLTPSGNGGWQYGNEYGLSLAVNMAYENGLTQPNCQGAGVPDTYKYYQLSAVLPDGSHHLLYLNGALDDSGNGYYQELPGATPACKALSTLTGPYYTYFTADGTYLKVVIAASAGNLCAAPSVPDPCWTSYTWTMYFPDGTQVIGQASQAASILDRNGNKVLISNVDEDLPTGSTQSLQYVFQDDLQRNIAVPRHPRNALLNRHAAHGTGKADGLGPRSLAPGGEHPRGERKERPHHPAGGARGAVGAQVSRRSAPATGQRARQSRGVPFERG